VSDPDTKPLKAKVAPKKKLTKAQTRWQKGVPNPIGGKRTNEYTQIIGDHICERLASGESLRSICRDADMPALATVLRWVAAVPLFCTQYSRAREEQAEAMVDEMLELANAPKDDSSEAINRARLQIDTRKWVAAKLRPKKYGDKSNVELTGAGGGAITVQRVDTTMLDDDQKLALENMLRTITLTPEDDD